MAPDRSSAILLGLILCIVAAFYWQRSRSTVLKIERRRADVERIAQSSVLTAAEVMALWETVGAQTRVEHLAARARAFAADRNRFGGSGLAVFAHIDQRALARELWAAAGEDPIVARAAALQQADAWRIRRYEHMVERFRSRLAATR